MSRNDLRESIYAAIDAERDKQLAKWGGLHPWGAGDCSSDGVGVTVKQAVLTEEVGEVARAVLERDNDQLYTELIQVAAVCVAWIEGL